MRINNYIRDIRFGIMPHNPLSSAVSKASDRGINIATLARISRDKRSIGSISGLREAVVSNLEGKINAGFDRSAINRFDRSIYVEAILKVGSLSPEDRAVLDELSDLSIAKLIEDNRQNMPALFELVVLPSRESINAFWALCDIKNPFKSSLDEVIRASARGERDYISEIPFNAVELMRISKSLNPVVLQEVAKNINTPDMTKMEILQKIAQF